VEHYLDGNSKVKSMKVVHSRMMFDSLRYSDGDLPVIFLKFRLN